MYKSLNVIVYSLSTVTILLCKFLSLLSLFLTTKGRIGFYDEYGVIRDVLQNHLTEVMTLLTMELPANMSDSEEVLRNRLQVLNSMLPLGKNQAVIGQYQAYKTEVQQELNKTKDHVSGTPTFAGEYSTFFFFSCSDFCHLFEKE